MTCPDQLLKPDGLEILGLIIGLVIGGIRYWYWEFGRPLSDTWGHVMNKFFPLVFGAAGLIAGFVIRIVWQHFC